MLAVVEGVSEAKSPGVMIYELDFRLNVLNARPDNHLPRDYDVNVKVRELYHKLWDELNA